MPRGGRKISAKDLAAQDQQVFCLKAYPSIKTPSNAFIVVHGGEGSGKTSDCLRIAEGYQPSAYAASEMKIGPSLAGYLRRLEIRAENLQIFDPATTDEIVEMASSGIRCLVLDSLSVLSLLPDDCTALAQGNDIIVIGILQHNKRGDAAGSNAWLHAADVVIECDSMRWVLRKSRYQAIDGIAGEVL
jgi:predicted ATP-dependent serine protease